VSKPFKFLHLIIIAILFMLIGSYLSRQSAPIVHVEEVVVVAETIVTEAAHS